MIVSIDNIKTTTYGTLSRLFKKTSDISILNSPFIDLAPKDDIDGDYVYTNAIDWALTNDNIKNIALTGTYGSGKSSILKTYQKRCNKYKYLNISLATFINKEKESDGDGEKNQSLEKSILQQLFYKVQHESIPNSRFKRIVNLSLLRLMPRIFGIIIFFLVGLFLVYPKTLNGLFGNINDIKQYVPNDFLIILLFISFLFTSIFLISSIVKYCIKNFKLNNVKVDKTEINIDKQSEQSIFNKYLDEILYFFEVTKYNVVIIEDIDRFNDITIFTKLRELNFLINNSEQVNKKVVFIYAIKDDMFVDKDRTKFFDFIIPVIPVVNSSNSGEILYKKISENELKDDISERFINDITIYIDDMRTLNNIYNEFIIYKDKLQGVTLDLEKLFGFIVYKNIYPDDFANLQLNKGIVYDVFNNKSRMKVKIKENLRLEINRYEEEIQTIEKEVLGSIKELKYLILFALTEGKHQIVQIDTAGKSYSIDTILSEAFDLGVFISDNIRIRTTGGNISSSLNDINSRIGYKLGIVDRINLIHGNSTKNLEEIKLKLSQAKKSEDNISHYTLFDLLNQNDIEDYFGSNVPKLILFLLRNGYIDEMYSTYISYFYSGSLTKNDMDFILSVKNHDPLEANHPLIKIDKIVERLNLLEFGHKEVLNYNFVDYLLTNMNGYTNYIDVLFTLLANESELSVNFINTFVNITINKQRFINVLCSKWNNIWNYIKFKSNFSTEVINEYLRDIILYSELQDITKIDGQDRILSTYISEMGNFCDLINPKNNNRLETVVELLQVRFKNLSISTDYIDFLNFIITNRFYNEAFVDQLKFAISHELLDDILGSDISQGSKIKLINNQLQYIDNEKNVITKYLNMIGSPYSALTNRGNKVDIENTPENLRLIRSLHKLSYIVIFKKSESILKIRA